MSTVDVERTIAAPIGEVFEWLTDTTNYWLVPIVRRVVLLRPGDRESAGTGAVREVRIPLLRLTERVIEYRRPVLMRYQIIGSRPRVSQAGGFLAFTEVPRGTMVRWHSRFQVSTAVGSGVLSIVMPPIVHLGFLSVLRTAERELRLGRRSPSIAWPGMEGRSA